jgi:hypothetical protein
LARELPRSPRPADARPQLGPPPVLPPSTPLKHADVLNAYRTGNQVLVEMAEAGETLYYNVSESDVARYIVGRKADEHVDAVMAKVRIRRKLAAAAAAAARRWRAHEVTASLGRRCKRWACRSTRPWRWWYPARPRRGGAARPRLAAGSTLLTGSAGTPSIA